MPEYERKPNTGSLWDEKKNRVSQKAGLPYDYYTGDIFIQCPKCHSQFDMWLTAFYNVLKSGWKVYNMSFTLKKPKDEQGAEYPPRTPQPQEPQNNQLTDMEIPF